MTTYTFESINSIDKVQFLTDTSGYVLDGDGQLSSFVRNETELINTPKNIKISNFHFITESQGAIIGHSSSKTQEASLPGASILLLTLLLLTIVANKTTPKFHLNRLLNTSIFAFLIAAFTVSCSNDWEQYLEQDPNSPLTTIIQTLPLSKGVHNFGGNIGQKSFFSETTDAGDSWASQKLPTNFNLTSIISVGKNYYVGTYAGESHSDGDLFILGKDSTYCKLLAQNENKNPFKFSANRGVIGLEYYEEDSTLVLFGGKAIFKYPKNSNSSTEGNITTLKTTFQPDYSIVKVSKDVVVTSYARLNNGGIYITLDNNKLLHTKGIKWDDITIKDQSSFKQVAFIPKTAIGYTLSTDGSIYETLDNGRNWERIIVTDVRKLAVFQKSILIIKKKTILKHSK